MVDETVGCECQDDFGGGKGTEDPSNKGDIYMRESRLVKKEDGTACTRLALCNLLNYPVCDISKGTIVNDDLAAFHLVSPFIKDPSEVVGMSLLNVDEMKPTVEIQWLDATPVQTLTCVMGLP